MIQSLRRQVLDNTNQAIRIIMDQSAKDISLLRNMDDVCNSIVEYLKSKGENMDKEHATQPKKALMNNDFQEQIYQRLINKDFKILDFGNKLAMLEELKSKYSQIQLENGKLEESENKYSEIQNHIVRLKKFNELVTKRSPI